MVGFNAGMNGVLAASIVGGSIGIAIGITLGAINFFAVFDGIARNSVYQGILGWSSWIMPMSWGATGLGLALFAFNLWQAGKNSDTDIKLAVDWRTGSIIMVGGLIRNGAGFNMGNFVFIDPSYIRSGDPYTSYDIVVRHETGHTLSVAAFGSLFHLYNLIDEVLLGNEAYAYGEKIAESHSKDDPRRPWIPMWG
jgi:hypothetical protein